eukprot:TRINITY_DN92289_c0_g1_i1.p1 TRINITY_DN92289_c0_g1~~TRINITY_DN92289_c0_g1_i1.p1  ORF type:complete len:344 (-),score=43.48 TRINITY_DN92289_c0_g1_i1:104-1135(-)
MTRTPGVTSSGAALAAALASAVATPHVARADCGSSKDRLWLPSHAAALGSSLTRRVPLPAPYEPVVQEPVRHRAVSSAAPAPEAGGEACAAAGGALHRTPVPPPADAARPRRPVSAQLPRRAAQTDPGAQQAAGKSSGMAVTARAWHSADAACANPALNGAEDPGWHPARLRNCEEVKYNPILHEVNVYVRKDGHMERAQPSKPELREIMQRVEKNPRKVGRQKGLAEFNDKCCAGRYRANPHHQAAFERNRHAFGKQRGPACQIIEAAAHMPGHPKVFENGARIPRENDDVLLRGPSVPTPRRHNSGSVPNRVRRPQSATEPRRGAPARISAPPSSRMRDTG